MINAPITYYSYCIETNRLDSNISFELRSGETKYKLILLKSSVRHYYLNIPSAQQPEFVFPYSVSNASINLLNSSARRGGYLTNEQIDLNKDLQQEGSIFYRLKEVGKPQLLIILFPHFKGPGGYAAPYSVLDGSNFSLTDVAYLSFQDCYLTQGSYVLIDNQGQQLDNKIVNIIKKCQQKLDLTESNLVFLGSSKGANIAIRISHYFQNNHLIACVPAMNLSLFLEKSAYSFVGNQLQLTYPAYKEFDYADSFKEQSKVKKCLWLYSDEDEICNYGNERDISLKNPDTQYNIARFFSAGSMRLKTTFIKIGE